MTTQTAKLQWTRKGGVYFAQNGAYSGMVWKDGRYWAYRVSHTKLGHVSTFAAAKETAEYWMEVR